MYAEGENSAPNCAARSLEIRRLLGARSLALVKAVEAGRIDERLNAETAAIYRCIELAANKRLNGRRVARCVLKRAEAENERAVRCGVRFELKRIDYFRVRNIIAK